MKQANWAVCATNLAVVLAMPVGAQVTQRASIATGGTQASGSSDFASISSDGRYVAFRSAATDVVIGDMNGTHDIFVRDRQTGTTERISIDSGGMEATGESRHPSISADGRYVAFSSLALNLVSGDTNGTYDIFVHDRQSGATERVSVDSGGAEGDGPSSYPSISADGRYVAFSSLAANLVTGDTNGSNDVFVHDRQNLTTERVSVDSSGAEGDSYSDASCISRDGRYVTFSSHATNLVFGDTNQSYDIFLRDRQNGTTERVSVASGGVQGDADSLDNSSISDGGRYVAFVSFATNLVPGDSNAINDVFLRDRLSGTTERVSVNTLGGDGNGSSHYPSVSSDGRCVAFASSASNLVPGDSNGKHDVFIRDLQVGTTERLSVDSGGTEGNDHSGDQVGPSTSADGHYVAFDSLASNLASGDTNLAGDVFVRDRDATSFTALCDPGVAGVHACPCSNPPIGLGHGCDNSSSTGGAVLSASGIAYLSVDSLVFTTSGERPTAFGILLQGDAALPSGVVYGQGIRCVGGSLRRLFAKTASGGSITAPDFGAGDPSVSVRSAALGDMIQSGQSRYYLVYYRDPIVLGGCSGLSTFNSTPTGQVAWSM